MKKSIKQKSEEFMEACDEYDQDKKIREYREYLEALDEEFLAYEFNDRYGCDPVGYYTNAENWDRKDVWIETLVDSFQVLLLDDPKLNWIQQDYLKACAPDCEICKKRYRASIYLDIMAKSEEHAQAIADQLRDHLGQPDMEELPEDYYNAYIGGVAELKDGDLLGNAKRLTKI